MQSLTELRTTRRRAKLEHTCTICSGRIPPGTDYEIIVFLDNDALGSRLRMAKLHLPGRCEESTDV